MEYMESRVGYKTLPRLFECDNTHKEHISRYNIRGVSYEWICEKRTRGANREQGKV